METLSYAPRTTRFSRKTAGSRPGSWRSERVYTAKKTCAFCGTEFRPWIKRAPDGTMLAYMKEKLWNRQKCCSISCAKHLNNPGAGKWNSRPGTPSQRGGNGHRNKLQTAIMELLSAEWTQEYIQITTEKQRQEGAPNHYKIDLANPTQKTALEIDGSSHRSKERRIQDIRKMRHLAQSGWRVYRISATAAKRLYTTCKSAGATRISPEEFWSIIAT